MVKLSHASSVVCIAVRTFTREQRWLPPPSIAAVRHWQQELHWYEVGSSRDEASPDFFYLKVQGSTLVKICTSQSLWQLMIHWLALCGSHNVFWMAPYYTFQSIYGKNLVPQVCSKLPRNREQAGIACGSLALKACYLSVRKHVRQHHNFLTLRVVFSYLRLTLYGIFILSRTLNQCYPVLYVC